MLLKFYTIEIYLALFDEYSVETVILIIFVPKKLLVTQCEPNLFSMFQAL